MKMLVYRVDTRKKERVHRPRINLERMLFLAFITAFAVLIVVQAALVTPSTRAFITDAEEFDGTPLGAEEFLYDAGTLGLELRTSDSNKDLKVLVNGDEVAVFNSKTLDIEVRNGDIIELDGSELKETEEIVIKSKSDNISASYLNKRLRIKDGVQRLMQVKIEELND